MAFGVSAEHWVTEVSHWVHLQQQLATVDGFWSLRKDEWLYISCCWGTALADGEKTIALGNTAQAYEL